MFSRLFALVFAGFLFLEASPYAQADPNVSDSYSYDAAAKLYTHSYQLPATPGGKIEAFWFYTPVPGQMPAPAFTPTSHSESSDWAFFSQYLPSLGAPVEGLLIWGWRDNLGDGVPLDAGQTMSITTPLPPQTVNYELTNYHYYPPGEVGGQPPVVGTVVGPSLPTSAPEPSTLALITLGGLSLAGFRWRRSSI